MTHLHGRTALYCLRVQCSGCIVIVFIFIRFDSLSVCLSLTISPFLVIKNKSIAQCLTSDLRWFNLDRPIPIDVCSPLDLRPISYGSFSVVWLWLCVHVHDDVIFIFITLSTPFSLSLSVVSCSSKSAKMLRCSLQRGKSKITWYLSFECFNLRSNYFGVSWI